MMKGSDVLAIVIVISFVILGFTNVWFLDQTHRRFVRLCYFGEVAITVVWMIYGLMYHVDWSR